MLFLYLCEPNLTLTHNNYHFTLIFNFVWYVCFFDQKGNISFKQNRTEKRKNLQLFTLFGVKNLFFGKCNLVHFLFWSLNFDFYKWLANLQNGIWQ